MEDGVTESENIVVLDTCKIKLQGFLTKCLNLPFHYGEKLSLFVLDLARTISRIMNHN